MIRNLTRVALVGLTLFVAHSGASLVFAKSANYTKALDAHLKRCAHSGWSGSVLIADKGAVVFERGYGFADRAKKRENDSTTLFEIASITKSFTACGILKLVEQKKLSLDDRIGNHLPGVPPDKQAITVAQLLSHTSGVSPRSTSGRGTDLEAAVQAYLAPPLAASPGSTFGYWNGGYALLAGIIERVSGGSYEAYMHKHVLKPAGMKSSGFTGERLSAKRQSTAYDGASVVRTAAEHAYGYYGWNYKGMGGLVTSAKDLLAFSNAMASGKLMGSALQKQMFTPVKQGYGLGWRIAKTKRGDLRVTHGGDVKGFHCQLDLWPSREACVVVLSNVNEAPSWRVSGDIRAMMEDQPVHEPAPPPIRMPKNSVIKKINGRYTLEGSQDAIRVEAQEGGLMLFCEGMGAAALIEPKKAGDPKSQAAAAKARRIIDTVAKGDYEALGAMIDPSVPTSWARTLTDSIWAKQTKACGAFASCAALSSHVQGPKRVMVKLRIAFKSGVRIASMGLTDGKLSYLKFDETRKDAPQGLSKRFVLNADDSWTSYNWNPRAEPAPTLSFELKRDAAESMLLTTADAKTTRLIKATD